MRKTFSIGTIALVVILLIGSVVPITTAQDSPFCPEGTAEISIAGGSVGQDLEILNLMLDDYMELCPNVQAEAVESPDQATERLAFFVQQLGIQNPAIDVYVIDVIWPAIVAEHMVDLYEYFPPSSETIQQHYPTIIENNTVDGRLVGMPWYVDAGLLYYRADLLEEYGLDVPQTWDELTETASIIQEQERAKGNSEFWGYVWQGNLGEPILINSLEWQASSGGGRILTLDGEVEVNNPETIEAIERAAGWIGTISPPTVIGHTPSNSNTIWQEGNAAFMRNWFFPYDISENNDLLRGRFSVTLLPSGFEGGPRASVLGGWQLAVSRYSNNIDASVKLVEYLASVDGQRFRAIQGGYGPSIPALYEDEAVLASTSGGLFSQVGNVLENTVPRPSTVSGEEYSSVANLYSRAVNEVLRGQVDARTALEDLEFDLEDLIDEILN